MKLVMIVNIDMMLAHDSNVFVILLCIDTYPMRFHTSIQRSHPHPYIISSRSIRGER